MNIIFDLDGTLIDSSASILSATEQAFRHCKYSPQVPFTEELIGPPLMKMLQTVAGTDDQNILENLAQTFKYCYDSEGYKKTSVFEGIDELLSELKADGHRLFIATNKRLIPTQKIISYLGWENYFEGIYALDTCPYATTKTQMLTYILDKHQLNFEESLYIGDTVPDRIAATDNAMPFLMVSWGYEFIVGEEDDYVTSASAIPQYVREFKRKVTKRLASDISFFSAKSQPYYIYVNNYSPKSAGIRALYSLCHVLNELGMEAYILGATEDHLSLRTPRLSITDVIRHEKTRRIPIAVYPEVAKGNPYQLPNVVRWLLNKPGLLGGPESFDDDEFIYAYTADYIPEGESYPLLTVPVVDSSIFNNDDNPYDNQRSGSAYYANKYIVSGGKLTHHVKNAFSLCQDQSLTPQQIADVLRRVEVLYCYEPSAIVREATLCGCPTVIIRSDYTDKNLRYPIAGEGIASTDSPEDLAYAKATIGRYKIQNDIFQKTCLRHVKDFAKNTQAIFSKRNADKQGHEILWSGEVRAWLKKQSSNGQDSESVLPRWFKNEQWLETHFLTEGRAVIMAEDMMKKWQVKPTFHLLMPLNPHELSLLSKTLESLQQQLYSGWGLTILSTVSAPELLKDAPENIEWIVIDSDINAMINRVVDESQLDWIMTILPGDKLSPHALLSFAEQINLSPAYKFISSDELVDEAKFEIDFKPSTFNLELLRSQSFLGRSVIVKRDAFEAVEGYTSFAYVAVTDIAFKIFELYGEMVFSHIPDVLFTSHPHLMEQNLLLTNEMIIRQGHLARCGIRPAEVEHEENNCFRVKYPLSIQPRISIVIANKNNATSIAQTLSELYEYLNYPDYELLLIDQQSDVEDMPFIYSEAESFFGDRFKLYSFDQENYAAAINYGVEHASGEVIVILSATTVIINSNWIDEMLPLLMRADVAVVGGRILDGKKKVVHAGGVLGVTDDRDGLFKGDELNSAGYMNRAHCVQEYPTVSSAALMIKKEAFQMVKGLDEEQLTASKYLIQDFCLKVKMLNKRVLWTPYALFLQSAFTNQKRNDLGVVFNEGPAVEAEFLRRWSHYFSAEPAFNAQLSMQDACFTPETTILSQSLPQSKSRPRVMVFPFSNKGVGEYRIRAPMRILEQAGQVEVIWMPNHELIKSPFVPTLSEISRWQPDCIFFHHSFNDIHYEFIETIKKYTDIKIIIGIDDLVHNIPLKSNVKKAVGRDLLHRLKKVAALCDRLIVSTPFLYEQYSSLAPDTKVIPNALESSRWLDLNIPVKELGRKPRVGWAGAAQHQGDLEIIEQVIIDLADKVDWIFMGMCLDTIKPYVKEYHEPVSYKEYPQHLADLNLDLALAPLEDHDFNKGKSNLRLLEYGIMSWPVIASDIEPYQYMDAPVFRVENTAEAWKEQIIAALAEPDKIAAKGKELNNWVRQKFILENQLSIWGDVFNF
ncbi:HAD hydrolase-like protein [Methylophaga sp.]|uniref:HAD hydrolase-like protein n=1 Tax=Methylophaga sp. TaxID=2024840 RepID=UPI003A8DCE05